MAIQITSEQIRRLQPYVIEAYISKLVNHCNEKFPYLKQTMGDERLRFVLQEIVNFCMQKGLNQEDTIRFYIDMCINFGISFEDDPQYFWSQEITLKYQEFGELIQAEMLYLEASKYLDHYYGQDEQLKYNYLMNLINYLSNKKIYQLEMDKINEDDEIDILLGIKKANLESFVKAKVFTIKNNLTELTDYIHFQLSEVAPQKYSFTPKEKIQLLVEQGIIKAKKKYSFQSQHEVTGIVLLMFMLGNQFDLDPFITPKVKMETDNFFDEYIVWLKQLTVLFKQGEKEYAS